MTIEISADGFTGVMIVEVLLVGSGSGVGETTVAVFVMVPVTDESTVPLMIMITVSPLATVPKSTESLQD